MIPQIKEIEGKFPKYATLSQATVTLNDMGDKTITAQVKIDGSIVPDFSYDWEIEFQGERYIQPLREPQASKGNESICSAIDLTFYHKGIYDLKRYFFVSTVELETGTLMADNYIVPLRLNIAEFVDYLNKVLSYYYGSTYKAYLNPDYKYDETDRKDIDINYTKIWDVLPKIYEWFGARWSWETQSGDVESYSIKIGYPSAEVSHIFEYGFEGGLLKFERQVQSPEIANIVFGRGSSENIPYRYFKNKSEDNSTFPADPDWIPELENIYFANLRGKTFRDYVKGWKAKHYGGEIMTNPTEEFNRGYNDPTFNPIEYVKDQESIVKYGEIQKGLEHNEEIKPTIQGATIDGIGRVDEVVYVEEILVDESSENVELASDVQPISENVVTWYDSVPSNDTLNMTIAFPTIDISPMKVAHIVKDVLINIVQHVRCTEEFSKYDATNNKWHILSSRTIQKENPLKVDSINVGYFDENTKTPINDLANIDKGVKLAVVVEAKVSGFFKKQTNIPHPNPNYSAYTGTITPDSTFKIITSLDAEIDYTLVHGQIIGNYKNGSMREYKSVTIPANGNSRVVFATEEFTISEDDAPATSVDMPYRITSSLKGGEYGPRPNVVAINVETGEQMTSLNLPAGTYYLQNSIQIENFASQQQTFKVELLPTYIYYSYDSASWKPTFDIWVKNIWNTKKEWINPSTQTGDKARWETDYEYEHRIWDAILGNHLGNEAKVVFSSGRLSGYSDWEFLIVDTPKRDTSKIIGGVPSEWRITLYKSDAEMEATNKWLPSTMTQAIAGDHFFFTGIELPHQYVLWAEEKVDKWKRENMHSEISPSWIISLDKVRVNTIRNGEVETLLSHLSTGAIVNFKDKRFTNDKVENRHIQTITTIWDENSTIPNIEIVLSDLPISTSTIKTEIDNAINAIASDVYRINDEISITNKWSKDSAYQSRKIKTWQQGFMGGVPEDTPKGIISAFKINTSIEIDRIKAEKLYIRVEPTHEILTDKDGKILKDSSGRILKAPIADEGYNDYKTYIDAANKYEAELSISLNSVGVPNITPEFESARNNYYEALNKVQNRINIDNDVKFLKKVFEEERVLDAYAATLSSLVAVMDEAKKIRAGLYGGGVEELDSIGLKSGEHGALMMFAGAQSLDDVDTSRFRVYEDGTVYQGVSRRSKTTITRNNLKDYVSLEVDENEEISSTVNLLKVGSFIVFDGFDIGMRNNGGQTKIRLPYYNGEDKYPKNYDVEDYLSFVGQTIVLKFPNGLNIEKYCIEGGIISESVIGTSFGLVCMSPNEGANNSIVLTCETAIIDGEMKIGWRRNL